jgi:uncharacterized membrane protein YeaQ/YmgE (transglycosylase-associated protein family)
MRVPVFVILVSIVRELIRFLLVGFVAGWIATIIVRGAVRTRGCLTNLVVGMLGAIIGGYLLELVGIRGVGSVITATIGAIVFLVFLRIVRTG